MSIRTESRFDRNSLYAAAEIRGVRRNREFVSNALICQAFKPRGGAKKGKSGTILQIPC